MAAKRKIAKPKPRMDLPWPELGKAQQNKHYVNALEAYVKGSGPNPGTSGDFHRQKLATLR